MKTIFKTIIIIIGILLILYSIIMAVVSNFNVGILVTLALGIFLSSISKLYKWLNHFQNKWFINIIKLVILTMLSFIFVIISTLF